MVDGGRSRYEQIRDEVFAVSETDPSPEESLPSELELQSKWFAGEFGREFHDTEGKLIIIKDFGIWNHQAGPDFLNATIQHEDQVLRGDIELDPDVTDWEKHGHAINPLYLDVVLHLYFRASSKTFFTKSLEHRSIPQIHLNLAMTTDHLSGKKRVPRSQIGRCAQPLTELSASSMHSLLSEAAQLRLQNKAKRFARIASIHGWAQAWYQGFAETLGYHQNQIPMRILTQRVLLKTLLSDLKASEARLFGHAGFLNPQSINQGRFQSETTRRYLRELWSQWWKLRGDASSALRSLPWIFHGNRPTNHPHRRLGALHALVSDWRTSALESPSPKELTHWIQGLKHPFWSFHFSWKSSPSKKPNSLFGSSRMQDFLINGWYPIKWAQEHLSHETLWEKYVLEPALQENQNLQRAILRLFGSGERALPWTKKAWQQQAILQIYEDFCQVDGSECLDCPFPEQLCHFHPSSISPHGVEAHPIDAPLRADQPQGEGLI